jgi:hypothetical protein
MVVGRAILPAAAFRRLSGLGKNPRALPGAGWKAGGSQDWLPHVQYSRGGSTRHVQFHLRERPLP